MSIEHKVPDVEFECETCQRTYNFNQLDVDEREDKLTYNCPVCSNSLYETSLDRKETN